MCVILENVKNPQELPSSRSHEDPSLHCQTISLDKTSEVMISERCLGSKLQSLESPTSQWSPAGSQHTEVDDQPNQVSPTFPASPVPASLTQGLEIVCWLPSSPCHQLQTSKTCTGWEDKLLLTQPCQVTTSLEASTVHQVATR